jgi:hypothetical protein
MVTAIILLLGPRSIAPLSFVSGARRVRALHAEVINHDH